MTKQERLIQEWKDAKSRTIEARTAWQDGKLAADELRKKLAEAIKAEEEIEEEIYTGKSSRPLIDAAEARGGRREEEESADERQRGPTVPLPRNGEPARDLNTLTNGKPRLWTAADLDRELEAACYPSGGPKPTPWKTYRDMGGITDAQIEAVLRQLWGSGGYLFTQPDQTEIGHTTRGGSRPSFWMGARKSIDTSPDLTGQPLVDRVRAVIDIPPFAVTEADLARIAAEDAAAKRASGKRKAVKA